MEIFTDYELFECPECGGAGLLEDESGWCMYVMCMECGCHTAEFDYRNDTEHAEAARLAAETWNRGKIVPASPGT